MPLNRKTPRLALAAVLALCATTAGVAAQGYGQRPYDRERVTRGDVELPARGRAADRDAREAFELGYRLGQEDERRFGHVERPGRDRDHYGRDGERLERRSRGDEDERQRGPSAYEGERPGRTVAGRADGPDLAILLVERDRQQQAMREVRQSLQEARAALQQGDQQRAQQAIGRAEQTSGRAAQAAQTWQHVDRSLGEADQALQRNDREGAQRALQQARLALQSHTSGGSTQQPPASGGAPDSAGPNPAGGNVGVPGPATGGAGGTSQR